jgi:hypothetical protein
MEYQKFIEKYSAFLRFRMDIMNTDIETIAVKLNRHPQEIYRWLNPSDDNLPNFTLKTLSKLADILDFKL